MSAELVSVIDAVLAYVNEPREQPWSESEVDEFEALAGNVYKLSVRADLVQCLPQISNLAPLCDRRDSALRAVDFVSKLNLPGDWVLAPGESDRIDRDFLAIWKLADDGPAMPRYIFIPYAHQRWFDDLNTLRSLASTPKSPVSALEALPDDAMMTHVELATALDLRPEPLRSRLRRWMKSNNDGWQEISEPRPRQPRYLYRVGSVRHILREALDSDRHATG